MRILYVEDDPDIRTVAQLALESLGGFTLEICDSGRAALERAPNFHPQLILLDVMMPLMDGPGTLKALRGLAQFAATPAVFMTAKVQPGEVAQYLALGATGVIPKPFDPMTLSIEVEAIWERCHD